jgi:hypothetical protein
LLPDKLGRRRMAAAMGASDAINASRQDCSAAILGASDLRPRRRDRVRVGDSQATLDATLACLRKGGEAVLVGLMGSHCTPEKSTGAACNTAATPATASHLSTWSPAMTPKVAARPPFTPPLPVG